MMGGGTAHERPLHRVERAQQQTHDRVAARIGPDGKLILGPGAFVGRAASYGTFSMGAAVGALNINHGWPIAPDLSQIRIVPGSANGTGWYVTAVDDTKFTLNRPTTTGTFTGAWAIDPT